MKADENHHQHPRDSQKNFIILFIGYFSIFTMLFITEICVKTLLFDMLITRYSTYPPQLLRTVIHLVAFSFRFVTFLIISCCYFEPNKFNTINENKHDAKRYVMTRRSILCVFLSLTRVGDWGNREIVMEVKQNSTGVYEVLRIYEKYEEKAENRNEIQRIFVINL